MSRDYLKKLGLYRATLAFTVVAIILAVAMVYVVHWRVDGGPTFADLFAAVALASLMGISFGYGTLALIFKLYSTEEELQQHTTQDTLTGANNRRYFMGMVEREWQRFRRYGDQFAILIFDIDGFKEINDIYGHLAGDEVLRQIAHVCSNTARSVDTFARYGGDEFVFLAPNSTAVNLPVFLERIRKGLEEMPVLFKGKNILFTISLGAMQASEHMGHYDEVLLGADQALGKAKRAGGNRYAIGEGEM
ncbi:GGDEF domain-containing protein [Chloroflexota bacterium]